MLSRGVFSKRDSSEAIARGENRIFLMQALQQIYYSLKKVSQQKKSGIGNINFQTVKNLILKHVLFKKVNLNLLKHGGTIVQKMNKLGKSK